ncbi:MAG TPA: DDE transposase family protein [Porphyromonadaceae bacterium]|nr:DDE transposase family protein [Porphyromonadaceae bacterium]
MANLTNEQKKEWAKLLFLRENLTQKEIAERVGVSAVTMNKWVKSGNWENLKVSITITKEEQLKNLYRQLAEVNRTIAERPAADGNRYATSAEADIISKLAASINKMESDIGLADIIATFQGLLSWLRTFDILEAQRIAPVLDGYVKTKIS